MFRIAVITAPERLPEEAQALQIVGDMPEVCALHLRKPDYREKELRQLIEALPAELRRKIRLHDHFELCEEYGLQGVHLNHRHPTPPAHIRSLSASCHNLQEVIDNKKSCDYVFLSPIFDSISKQGYASKFSPETLMDAAKSGIIDHQVFALGGVRAKYIPMLRQWGFGGAAMLGEIWEYYKQNPDLDRFSSHLKNLFNKIDGKPWI